MADSTISISVNLDGDVEGQAFQIRNVGERNVRIDVADLSTLISVRRTLRGLLSLRKIGRAVKDAGFRAEVFVSGDRVVALGDGAESLLLRLFGYSATEVKFGTLIPLVTRRR